jgi:pyruvate dehydrogenase E1 component
MTQPSPFEDIDPTETQEWLESIDSVMRAQGPQRAHFLLEKLVDFTRRSGAYLPFKPNTAYLNTISKAQEPEYPGDRSLERRNEAYIRWNALAMVVRANRASTEYGGHIGTYASAATLYEVGFNHFWRARSASHPGDMIFMQGHSSPGIYARAYLEGRLDETQLQRFRQEVDGGGLSSYPHPWLMPEFWQFPTVSMGLGPMTAIFQARFVRYLEHRGIVPPSDRKVWAFLGDGEMDEPESMGALTMPVREQLDNLIFVINCNLQRLDGPVRGNGKIIQELEAVFRGAGWNVIKVVWGDSWDPLLAKDKHGLLVKRMGEVVDGEYQKYTVMPGEYIREHFFGKYPELAQMVRALSDEELKKLRRGGHDPEKVYAAYKAAVACKGKPTVILAKTIKGYGTGEAGEGRNVTHQQKKLGEKELREFRSRFGIPISDDEVSKAPFYRPAEDSEEAQYLKARRKELGGFVPERSTRPIKSEMPRPEAYQEFFEGSGDREVSTTMAFVGFLTKLLKDKQVGKNIVPIVPDESRTFGMEGLFRQCGIYSHAGQLYEPVDSGMLTYYREAKDGQLLEEGITEAGSMSSFIAAGTAYSTHGINMIPFFIYYSMFGFQRIGDLIWAATDCRAKGFLIGGTAGRTTLAGEGLQHQDGQSLLNALAFPTVRAYDPAFAYETATIILDGMKRMYEDLEDAIYYITVENENYRHPPMPQGVSEAIIRGIYKFSTKPASDNRPHVQLFGSGAILREALRAQEILADKYRISSNVWSVTSYTELARDAQAAERWNMLHPTEPRRVSYIEQVLQGESGPFVSASDYVRALAEQISPFVPGGLFPLGTDGFGRSETRPHLRRHFEVDAEAITVAALYQLSKCDQVEAKCVAGAIKDLGIDPEKVNPLRA